MTVAVYFAYKGKEVPEIMITDIVNAAIRRLGPAMRVYPPREKVKDINFRFGRATEDKAIQLIEDSIKAGYTCGLCKAFAEILTILIEEGNRNLMLESTKEKLVVKLKKYENTTTVYKQAISDIFEDIE